ncbi:lytic transglycosylase domain-containing protein [Gordonia neofelifaecis]|uniref:Membrane-bound lytic murein transglycosylase B-like protein n=1 Tax=Gordonia neofelifaecis NRRL B-59395 TaxID=644548 RepID=F1YKT2_9ACTN|nr:lytic murein transglycosylase [Gordonia neofelifaecis]EGD54726.1 Membrane-bound lytic murein transglycosylase B- like protein [Gordonia neofelifaecis NRRL B-59395]
MHPNRKSLKSALFVAAGLVPVTGALLGVTSSSPDRVAADPTPVHADAKSAPSTTETPVRPVAAKAPAVAPAPALPASVTTGVVPEINFKAYKAAADSMAKTAPGCHIDWKLIGGIGRVESQHANFGDADANGQLRHPIYGPVLDGSLGGNEVITDTDGGRLDGDPVYDRAVGPTQFLPATWQHYAADGNGDGKADPQNLYDAALTTARYLCDDNLDLATDAGRSQAVLRYNNSMDYVSNVLGFARSY